MMQQMAYWLSTADIKRVVGRGRYQRSQSTGFNRPDIPYRSPIADPGDHGDNPVDLTTTSRLGHTAKATATLLVTDQADPTPDILQLPDDYGDVSNDGKRTLVDAYRIARRAGQVGLQSSSFKNGQGDLNLDGQITLEDVSLASHAVLNNEPIPNQLLTTQGPPGTVVTMISPALLAPDTQATVSFESGPVESQLIRPIRGYINFIIPFQGPIAAAGDHTVHLMIDGHVAQSFTFKVTDAPAAPDDPVARMNTFLDNLSSILQSNTAQIQSTLSDQSISEQARQTLLAFPQAGEARAQAGIDTLRAMVNDYNGEKIARVMLAVMQANGLGRYVASLNTYRAGSGGSSSATGHTAAISTLAVNGDEVCDKLLPAFCSVKQASNLISSAGDMMQTACDALAIGTGVAVLSPEDGPVGDVVLKSKRGQTHLKNRQSTRTSLSMLLRIFIIATYRG